MSKISYSSSQNLFILIFCANRKEKKIDTLIQPKGQMFELYTSTYFQSLPSDLLSSEFWRWGYCFDMTRRAAWAHTINAFIGRLMCSFLRSDVVLLQKIKEQEQTLVLKQSKKNRPN
jgi:hypothetical protein